MREIDLDRGTVSPRIFAGNIAAHTPFVRLSADAVQEGAAILGGKAGAIIQYTGNAIKSDDPKQSKRWWLAAGLSWLAHIAVDRVTGFGLRKKDGWPRG